MSRRRFKFPRARVVALAVGIGAVGSLAVAPAAFAAGAGPKPPTIGANCQPDGKINGGGSTFQTNAVNNAFTFGFQQDVCGPQPNVSNLTSAYGTSDPSIFSFTVGSTTNNVAGMVAYNYSLGGVALTNGSGAGLRRVSCRTDMFGGTDLPYNSTQLGSPTSHLVNGLDGPVGSESGGTGSSFNCNNGTLNTTAVPPPYGPQPTNAWPTAADAASNVMSFPTAGGAVAYAVNLNGMCSNTNGSGGTTAIPTGLNLTGTEFDDVWQGTINQWNDPTLVATNPNLETPAQAATLSATTVSDGGTNPAGSVTVASAASGFGPSGVINIGGTNFAYTSLSGNTFTGATIPANIADGTSVTLVPDNCTGNIQRVTRLDNSGTTAITMFTLSGIDKNTLCAGGNNWYAIAISSSNNGQWPAGCTAPGTGTVAPNEIHDPTTNGSPALITLLEKTNGGIGYAELGLWGTPPSGVSFVNLQNATNTAFVGPGIPGNKSNCALPTSIPTGSTPQQAVGLATTTPTWSNSGTGAAPGKQDIADTGSGYPACGLTFDLVYTNQVQTGEVAAPAAPPATPGCTITAPTPTTTTADVTFPVATVPVASTAGFPKTGTLNVGGQTVTYTGLDATDFTGVTGGSGLVTSGSAVSLVSTTAAATATTPGVNGACQSVGGAIVGMTNDQQRTLYAYFTYVFSPLGQTNGGLPGQTLDPLPAGWLTTMTQGYQQNF